MSDDCRCNYSHHPHDPEWVDCRARDCEHEYETQRVLPHGPELVCKLCGKIEDYWF